MVQLQPGVRLEDELPQLLGIPLGGGYGITDKCKEYLYPLIKGEAYPDYDDNGMPKYVTLKLQSVPQKLDKFDI